MQRVFRLVDDPNHVFILLEFDAVDDANEARRRLLESGVLDRFEDKHGPNVLEEATPRSSSTGYRRPSTLTGSRSSCGPSTNRADPIHRRIVPQRPVAGAELIGG